MQGMRVQQPMDGTLRKPNLLATLYQKRTFWHLVDLRFIKNLFFFHITRWETFMGQTPICQKPASGNFDEGKTSDASTGSFLCIFASCFWCSQCFMPEIEVSKLKWSTEKKAPFALSNGISLAYWDLCSWKGNALTPRRNARYILIRCGLNTRVPL